MFSDKESDYTPKQKKELNIQDVISHPTQKPVNVTEKLLDACIKEGTKATVVIPFAGTGSECYVCDQRDYEWVGFEINKDYVDMGNILIKDRFPANKT